MKQIILAISLLLLVACKEQDTVPKPVSIQEDIAILASDDFEGRKTGTEGEQKAAHYLKERFQSIGLKPMGEAGTYFQTFSFKASSDPHQEAQFSSSTDNPEFSTGTNVIGYLDHKATHTIVIGAHYDHLGLGGEGSLHREGAAIHNGADDNASGTAIMLQLAATLNTAQFAGNNYLFIAFSGEELGLLGSNYFTKNPTVPIDQINYMINMDMVGRLNAEKTIAVHGVGTSPIWKQTIFSANSDFILSEHESGVGPSDHTSFYLQDIPVLHFFTGQHEDYHKPGDDIEKLNYEGMDAIQEYITNIVLELNDNGKLKFTKTKNESEAVPRFKVTLGVVPDYLYAGEGMRIDGVSDDRPAQKAGLEKGDIITQLGDSTVTDIMSYMRVLSTFDEGDNTTVNVNRAGNTVKATITFDKN